MNTTQTRIIDAALELFNERGTAAVSTNHIAEKAAVSPGNLYYHFRNKEDVIRAIFIRIERHWETAFTGPTDESPSGDSVRRTAERTYAGLWKFRFFYRELGALIRRDPVLGHCYRELRKRGLEGTKALLGELATEGVLTGLDDSEELARMANALMLISEFWLAYEEAGGERLDGDHARKGTELTMTILTPRLRQERDHA